MKLGVALLDIVGENIGWPASESAPMIPLKAGETFGREDLAHHAAEFAGGCGAAQLFHGCSRIGRNIVHQYDLIIFVALVVGQLGADSIHMMPGVSGASGIDI